MDFCFETLGTKKHKQPLNSRRINKVDSESFCLPAAKDKENITNTVVLSALGSDAIKDDLQADSPHLPGCIQPWRPARRWKHPVPWKVWSS